MIDSEFKLIESIKKKVNSVQAGSERIYGIGDDCAVYRISDSRFGLFSTDISVENVHFDLQYTPLFDVGYRSMSANISDIYAMGGRPVLALVSLGIPPNFSAEMISELYDGILSCAVKYGTAISGGDTSKASELVVNISIYGETSSPVYRNNAGAGERIYLTGNTGLSQLGLEILRNGLDRDKFPMSVEKHLKPEPCGSLIDTILHRYSPSSMIDISDGLLVDLGHICAMSGRGFELYADKIPVHGELADFCAGKKISVTDYSLYSGEEYELLFSTKKEIADDEHITYIGNITENGYYMVSDNSRRPLELKGYDHFR